MYVIIVKTDITSTSIDRPRIRFRTNLRFRRGHVQRRNTRSGSRKTAADLISVQAPKQILEDSA